MKLFFEKWRESEDFFIIYVFLSAVLTEFKTTSAILLSNVKMNYWNLFIVGYDCSKLQLVLYAPVAFSEPKSLVGSINIYYIYSIVYFSIDNFLSYVLEYKLILVKFIKILEKVCYLVFKETDLFYF